MRVFDMIVEEAPKSFRKLEKSPGINKHGPGEDGTEELLGKGFSLGKRKLV